MSPFIEGMPISKSDPKIRGRFVCDTLQAVEALFPQLDAGELVVIESPDDVVILEWQAVPPGISGKGGYLEGTAGALEAVLELARIKNGRVKLEFDNALRCSRFVLHWHKPS